MKLCTDSKIIHKFTAVTKLLFRIFKKEFGTLRTSKIRSVYIYIFFPKLMFIMLFFFLFEFLNYFFSVFTVTNSQNPESFKSQFPGFQY